MNVFAVHGITGMPGHSPADVSRHRGVCHAGNHRVPERVKSLAPELAPYTGLRFPNPRMTPAHSISCANGLLSPPAEPDFAHKEREKEGFGRLRRLQFCSRHKVQDASPRSMVGGRDLESFAARRLPSLDGRRRSLGQFALASLQSRPFPTLCDGQCAAAI